MAATAHKHLGEAEEMSHHHGLGFQTPKDLPDKKITAHKLCPRSHGDRAGAEKAVATAQAATAAPRPDLCAPWPDLACNCVFR
uniref:Uncharacterized protein n=1 Tax=Leersia perrieri TaxID=77586 RepID=A0A0D9WF10_9ORYZ